MKRILFLRGTGFFPSFGNTKGEVIFMSKRNSKGGEVRPDPPAGRAKRVFPFSPVATPPGSSMTMPPFYPAIDLDPLPFDLEGEWPEADL